MNQSFRGYVTGLVDLDARDESPEYPNCIEVTVRGIFAMLEPGERLVMVNAVTGMRQVFVFKKVAIGKRPGRPLETGELPIVLEKPPELAGVPLVYHQGLSLELE